MLTMIDKEKTDEQADPGLLGAVRLGEPGKRR